MSIILSLGDLGCLIVPTSRDGLVTDTQIKEVVFQVLNLTCGEIQILDILSAKNFIEWFLLHIKRHDHMLFQIQIQICTYLWNSCLVWQRWWSTPAVIGPFSLTAASITSTRLVPVWTLGLLWLGCEVVLYPWLQVVDLLHDLLFESFLIDKARILAIVLGYLLLDVNLRSWLGTLTLIALSWTLLSFVLLID